MTSCANVHKEIQYLHVWNTVGKIHKIRKSL